MNEAGFRWAVILMLGIIAFSLYALSGMVAIGMSRRLGAASPTRKD